MKKFVSLILLFNLISIDNIKSLEKSDKKLNLYSNSKYITPITNKKTGWQIISNKKYYFQENGKNATGIFKINDQEYVFDDDGEYIGIQYKPVYYNQKDKRWEDEEYEETLGKTGCLPTCMSMAISGLTGNRVLPTEIADYLYNYTDEYNKDIIGATGLAIEYAASYYNIKYQGINSLKELNKSLKEGKIIIANMGDGKYADETYTHAIIAYKYKNGKTYTLDPNETKNNMWIKTKKLWKQRSKDKLDLKGGYAFYALYK